MKTKIISIDPMHIDEEKLEEAAQILRAGGTVAFPTETVYGLGANALDADAVQKIFQAKGRPSDNPLIVHIAHFEDLLPLVREIPPQTRGLADRFWPGPLTLIFKKGPKIPDVITGGLDTVAIRMPSHPIARKLIERAGVPIAAPSANLSGRPSPTRGEHVLEDLKGRVDGIITGGSCRVGLESTVLDISEEVPTILRPGGVTLEVLREFLNNVQLDPGLEEKAGKEIRPKSPGMKYTHYAPKAEMLIVEGEIEGVVKAISQLQEEKEREGLKVGIMATEETKDKYSSPYLLSVGSRSASDTIAANLFDTLRHFDEMGVDMILAEGISQKELGHAVMNRMMKAASYRILYI
ncbi:MAG: L-threonylcarbamoyladenylate synthase [Thermotaleaceae bacterium]